MVDNNVYHSSLGRVKGQLAFFPVVVLGLALAQPSASQDRPDSVATRAAGFSIEEITVTARRREESLQRVPFSIQVFDQETLSNRNILSSRDLVLYSPSLSISDSFGPESATFSLRGFSQQNRTSASVGVYFADVVAPQGGVNVTGGNGAVPGSFFDLENVQVLKGPQGTLFGRNTTGGAIILVPRKPTSDFGGHVEGTVGNFNHKRVEAVANIPVNDRFRTRLGLEWTERDGYLNNISGVGPSKSADQDYISARASMVFDISDSIENYTIMTYTDSKSSGSLRQIFACRPGTNFTGFCEQQLSQRPPGFYDIDNSNPSSRSDLEQKQIINTLSWEVSDSVTVKNIISYANLKTEIDTNVFGVNWSIPDGAGDIAGLNFGFTNAGMSPGVPSIDQRSMVVELQVQGLTLGDRLDWQAGLYYERSKPSGDAGTLTSNFLSCDQALGSDPSSFSCQDVLRQFFAQNAGVPAEFLSPVGNVQRQFSWIDTENRAVYGQASYAINEQFSVTGGVRYTIDDVHSWAERVTWRGFPTDGTGVAAQEGCMDPNATAAPTCRTEDKKTTEAPTWTVGLDYTPTDNQLFYAKYTRGYRRGGVNLVALPGFQSYEEEKVDAFEVGSKTSFYGVVPGSFNVSAHYNELTDQQLQIGVATVGQSPVTSIVNAGKSVIWGVEVETLIQPTPSVQLGLSYAYLNTELKQIDMTAGGEGVELVPTAVEGGALPLSPRHSFSASASYQLPLSDSMGSAQVGVNYVYLDDQVAAPNSPFGSIDSYGLVNADMNWKNVMGGPVDLSLFATNLFQKKYLTNVTGTYTSGLGAEASSQGVPRMFGVRLRYNFGL